MKVSSGANVSMSKGKTVQSAQTVCMHVLGPARTDVRVMRAATALAKAGFQVSVVDIERESTRPAEEEIRGVWVRHVIIPEWSVSSKSFDPRFLVRALVVLMRSIFLLLRTPADVYHAHDETALPSCYVAALLRRKPLIFDAHEVPSSSLKSAGAQGLKARLKRLFLVVVPRCKAVITISPSIVEVFRQHYRCREVCLIRNVPEYHVVARSDRLRRYLHLDPDVRIALYQGNLQPDRGLDSLIRSAAFLEPNSMLVLMGRGIRDMQSQLEALIASEGIAERVKIIPPVPYEELLAWTASADLGVIFYSPDYPEVQMYLPNKIFEYMMAGLPFLSSPVDAVAEVINTYDVGQVLPSLAPVDIGATINALLADRLALERMRRNALEASRQDFSWEKESQRLVRLYHGIVGMPRAEVHQ
ncbi:MAG: glycosyltransferase family 4 protein [Ktedonobacteraceae bacterium]